jgi:putative heme-binding domain-containing protein
LARINHSESQRLLTESWLTFQAQQLDSALHLDLFMAIDSSSFAALKQQKNTFESTVDPENALKKYAATFYGGNVERGRQIYNQDEGAQCQRCHATNSTGAQVGPPLKGIGQQLSRKDLVLALVAPNDRIAPGYGTVILSLKNGAEKAGILLEETKEKIKIQVRQDSVLEISKKNIQERETLPSGMFNMGDLLTKKQIRDLVAYLVEN